MKILKSKKSYKHHIGDILFGKEYLENVNLKDLKKKKYVYGISIRRSEFKKELKKHFEYQCPFIDGNRYLWFLPSYVFTDTPNENDFSHHFQKDPKSAKIYGYKKDRIEEIEEFDEHEQYNNFGGENLYMGHGYTFGTLPSDGGNGKDVAMIRLDNGDILVGQLWVWFNK